MTSSEIVKLLKIMKKYGVKTLECEGLKLQLDETVTAMEVSQKQIELAKKELSPQSPQDYAPIRPEDLSGPFPMI